VAVAALGAATGLAAAGQRTGEPAVEPSGEPPAAVRVLDEIALPDAFRPEGIAIGDEPVAFVGSLADGAIFKADLTTGEGEVIGTPPGTPSVGLALDGAGRLFVAGGREGDARVVDTETGDVLASFDLAGADVAEAFVNDVALTAAGAFFTDSLNAVLYHLPIGADGTLPAAADVQRIPLTGDIVYADGNNANGIEVAPDGETLIIVQSNKGLLFAVDPATGVATQTQVVDVEGDGLVANGDGLLVVGQTLFVVQNRDNLVAKLQINATGTQADVVDRVTDARFDVPTTVAAFGETLFLPNAKFGTEVTPETPFEVVGIPQP
jgi:streptogramin lyase